MKIFHILILTATIMQSQINLQTPFERGNGNQTATYQETIAYFKMLDDKFETISIREMGLTDSGEPLHIVIFDTDKKFDFSNTTKAKLLINNGIHPGEPDGIDATMQLFRDLAIGKIKVPKNVMIANIPIYNIGGALNRNSHCRANQNGPESYGFRGNARNFDLNRDFVKADTRNAQSFAEIFHFVQPDLFIDNHVSNGADYQYTFTYIATQYQKLGGELGNYWKMNMIPQILSALKKQKTDAVTYVNVDGDTPDKGFDAFMDSPRYSTGFAAMFDVPGTMPETHMLKKYSDRVLVTYQFMVASLDYLDQNYQIIKTLRKQNQTNFKPQKKYTLQWEIDRSKKVQIPFRGFEGGYKPSDVSGEPRLFYDRKKPFEKQVDYYGDFTPALQVTIPEAYVIPRSCWQIIEHLERNKIEIQTLKHDTIIEVEEYRIADYKTMKNPYEGHYPHYEVKINSDTQKVSFKAGDYIVDLDQSGVKYLMETLEPQGVDSFFAWNFFDSILQQKEHFSPYVFEDTASEMLRENPKLKSEFDKKKSADESFSASAEAQLDWIYKNSDYYEKTHNLYPIYRKMK